MAVENLITEHIDIWTSVVKTKSPSGRGSSKKLELYGVKKLRELILELAVRGKLVPQDPNDEPASALLERIEKEKAQLLKEKKIKKTKALPSITEDEKPFELPTGWNFERLDIISHKITDGEHISPKKLADGVKLLSAKHILDNGVSLDEPQYVSHVDAEKFRLRCDPDIDDVLVCSRGTIGRCCTVTTKEYFCLMGSVILIRPPLEFVSKYLSYFLKSPTGQLSIKGMTKGMAVNALYLKDIKNAPIPVPPLKEQHRIVSKVDELVKLCDQLEQQTEASIEAHQVLVTTLLGTLTNAQNATELMQNWQMVAEHFDTLFTTEESIDQLKQTILQLAVMGKLVPQDPFDEPAAILLERIAEEKEQLIKDKKIKNQKALPPITEDEKPFELPNGWEWERIGTFGVVGTGATPSRSNPKYWDSPEHNWVSSGETAELFVGETKEKVSELAIKETNVSVYPVGTLIVAMYGQGKTRGQITELTEPAGTNQACAAIQLIENNPSHKDFVKLYFRKSYEELRSNAAGGAQPNLNVGKVQSTVIAIPPLKEQQRINAKVDELLIVCELLKGRIKKSQTTQLQLTDTIVEQVV